MSEHAATVEWRSAGEAFDYESYARDHTWSFPGGARVEASAAPAYRGSAERVDPEEAFVASVASCHMLTFLAIAARRRFCVESYRDAAVGTLEKNAEGRLAVTRVVLRPEIEFSGESRPTPEQIATMHAQSHRQCFIANSIRTEVTVETGARE